MLTVERFDCEDDDVWFSVYDTDSQELATCVMHSTPEAAEQERRELDA